MKRDFPDWVKKGLLSSLIQRFSHDLSVPPELQFFIDENPVEPAKQWERELIKKADTMPLEELTEWVEDMPSGWSRAKMMEILQQRSKGQSCKT